MNKLMYRFVATTKKKRNRPVLRHGMPLKVSRVISDSREIAEISL